MTRCRCRITRQPGRRCCPGRSASTPSRPGWATREDSVAIGRPSAESLSGDHYVAPAGGRGAAAGHLRRGVDHVAVRLKRRSSSGIGRTRRDAAAPAMRSRTARGGRGGDYAQRPRRTNRASLLAVVAPLSAVAATPSPARSARRGDDRRFSSRLSARETGHAGADLSSKDCGGLVAALALAATGVALGLSPPRRRSPSSSRHRRA